MVDLWDDSWLFVLVRMCVLAGADMSDLCIQASGPTIALERILSFHSDTDRYGTGRDLMHLA